MDPQSQSRKDFFKTPQTRSLLPLPPIRPCVHAVDRHYSSSTMGLSNVILSRARSSPSSDVVRIGAESEPVVISLLLVASPNFCSSFGHHLPTIPCRLLFTGPIRHAMRTVSWSYMLIPDLVSFQSGVQSWCRVVGGVSNCILPIFFRCRIQLLSSNCFAAKLLWLSR